MLRWVAKAEENLRAADAMIDRRIYAAACFHAQQAAEMAQMLKSHHSIKLIDERDVDMAVAEGFEERGLGLTIMNRLRKANGFKIIK